MEVAVIGMPLIVSQVLLTRSGSVSHGWRLHAELGDSVGMIMLLHTSSIMAKICH